MKRGLFAGIVFLGLLAALASPGRGADNPDSDPVVVDFAGVTSVPLEFHDPVRRALEESATIESPAGPLTVSVFEQDGALAHLVLVPTAVVESGWQLPFADEEIVDVFARADAAGQWQAHVLSEATASLFADLLPPRDDARALQSDPALLFPWHGGNWWIKLGYPGWHGKNAVDFKPSDPADRNVLAAGAGTLSQVCNDGYQSILRIDHGAASTRYIHLDAATIPGDLLYQSVERGELLGQLFDGHVIDDGYCWDSPDWQFNTHCGCGTTMHLHFENSDPDSTVDGYNYTDVAYSEMGTPYLSHNGSSFSPYPDARFLEQEGVAATMVAGKSYAVSLTFQNVGNEEWDDQYRLGSLHPAGGLTWDRARVYFGSGETVSPGESKRFDFTVTAPATPGPYDFQWQLLDAEGEAIGDASSLVEVEVVQPLPYGFLEQPPGPSVAGTVEVGGWAAVDGGAVDQVEIWVDGQYVADAGYGAARPDAGGNFGFLWQWDTTSLVPGIHSVEARAVAGARTKRLTLASGEPPPSVVTVSALPTGTIDEPAAGATVAGTVRVAGQVAVTGSTIDRVQVYVDDRLAGEAAVSANRFAWEWDASRAGSGEHTVRVRAVANTGAATWLPVATTPHLTALTLFVEAGVQPGDADGNGRVDGVDYVVWLNHVGMATANGAQDGDFNGDGQVDDLDYQIWEDNYDG